MPAAATEKPDVEHRVYDLQRRWCYSGAEGPGPRRPECPPAAAAAWPNWTGPAPGRLRPSASASHWTGQRPWLCRPHAFDPCIQEPKKVDKYQTVAFDSQPLQRAAALGLPGGDRQGATWTAWRSSPAHQVIARHPRCYGRSQQILDPLHYLVDAGPAAGGFGPQRRVSQLAAARPRSSTCGQPWKNAMAHTPAAGSTSACCNCWPSIR